VSPASLSYGESAASAERGSGNEPEPSSRRMWPGGPLRLWSEARISASWLKHDSGDFYGPYFCEMCRKPSDGVYAARASAEAAKIWLCGACKPSAKASS